MSGLACRYKTTADGNRQIFAFMVPGDFCDLHVALLTRMDHSIATLAPSEIVDIPYTTILELTDSHPGIAKALLWSTLVDEAILREWLTNMGQRQADARIAHLFCELYVRMETVGLAERGSFELPLTQIELADMMGLSTVHASRSLKALREAGLARIEGKKIVISDVERLKAYADFDPVYLHRRQDLFGVA